MIICVWVGTARQIISCVRCSESIRAWLSRTSPPLIILGVQLSNDLPPEPAVPIVCICVCVCVCVCSRDPQCNRKLNIYLEHTSTELCMHVTQVPVIQVMLGQLGLVTSETMLSQWRYVVVGSTVVAAVLTPSTDPFTQVCVL